MKYTILQTTKEGQKINSIILLETNNKTEAENKYQNIIKQFKNFKPEKTIEIRNERITSRKQKFTYVRIKKANLIYQIEIIEQGA